MSDSFIRRIKSQISRAEHASADVLEEIEEALQREPSAALWILHGDALQLCDDEERLEEAEESYEQALELDPKSAEAYESLGHFIFAIHDDARASLPFFEKAIELGAGASAREGLREAREELADEE
jgi:tetratricopeptide (TPR) repeat protein